MRVGRWLVMTVLGVALFVGCATTEQKPMAAKQKSLYERLGGKDAITAVVDDFVGRVAADTRINGFFATADIPGLKRNLVNQICAASGGPCTYTGRDMKTTHRGMGVTNAHFDALVGIGRHAEQIQGPRTGEKRAAGSPGTDARRYCGAVVWR